MKKALLVLVTILFALGFTYCGQKTDPGAGNMITPTPEPTEPASNVLTPQVSGIDLNSATPADEIEITLSAPTTYNIRLYGENFESGAKVVLAFNGVDKIALDYDKIIRLPSAADEIWVKDVSSANFDQIGTWSAYVKNDDTHKSDIESFEVKGVLMLIEVNPKISTASAVTGLPAGTYNVSVNTNYANQHASQHYTIEYYYIMGTRMERIVRSGFCFNVRFNGEQFWINGFTDMTDSDQAYDAYSGHTLDLSIPENGSISYQFFDLSSSPDLGDNEGRLYFRIQRVQ